MNPLAWFRALSLSGRIGLGIAIIAGAALIVLTINGFVDRAFDRAERKGAAASAADAATKGLEHVEQANEAAHKVTLDAAARRAGCLRHSRTPQNCQ